MNLNLITLHDKLEATILPEDIFGALPGGKTEQIAGLRDTFRGLARVAHPDSYADAGDREMANRAFQRLNELYGFAGERVAQGRYPQADAGPREKIVSGRCEYHLSGEYSNDGVCLTYPAVCRDNGALRSVDLAAAADPTLNDLVRNQASILEELGRGASIAKFAPFLPELVETFTVQNGLTAHTASVFAARTGWYSLHQVRERYPGGVDARDMAWMYRRLLTVLGFLHTEGVVHGAVLPGNILIQPEEHGLILVHFYSATSLSGTGRGLPLCVSHEEQEWYPPEMAITRSVSPAVDLYLAARCMRSILGAEPTAREFPSSVPQPLASFLRGCLLPHLSLCPGDAWSLKDEFDDLLGNLWGKRKFHPFSMEPAV
jgi:hypothetical protein